VLKFQHARTADEARAIYLRVSQLLPVIVPDWGAAQELLFEHGALALARHEPAMFDKMSGEQEVVSAIYLYLAETRENVTPESINALILASGLAKLAYFYPGHAEEFYLMAHNIVHLTKQVTTLDGMSIKEENASVLFAPVDHDKSAVNESFVQWVAEAYPPSGKVSAGLVEDLLDAPMSKKEYFCVGMLKVGPEIVDETIAIGKKDDKVLHEPTPSTQENAALLVAIWDETIAIGKQKVDKCLSEAAAIGASEDVQVEMMSLSAILDLKKSVLAEAASDEEV